LQVVTEENLAMIDLGCSAAHLPGSAEFLPQKRRFQELKPGLLAGLLLIALRCTYK